jgi:ribosomal protein S18 acetylase RimI-like enzyme
MIHMEGGRLAGVILSMRRGPTVGRVLVMAVRPGYQDMGIGSHMLKAFIQQCLRESIVSVVLEVRVTNRRAQEFYRRFGFRPIERLTRYYPDDEDAVMMTMEIA